MPYKSDVDRKEYHRQYQQLLRAGKTTSGVIHIRDRKPFDREKALKRMRDYGRDNYRAGGCESQGSVVCPKCGERGLKRYQRLLNRKTGVYHVWCTVVCHRRGHERARYCWIGVGRL